MRRTHAFLLSTIVVGFTALTAHADSPDSRITTTHVAVAYGDLDLGEEADARRLLDRIAKAARRACGRSFVNSASYTDSHRRVLRCREAATLNAVSQLNHPVLTAVYNAKGRHLGRRVA